MSVFAVLSGLSGALGLYSGIKGMFESSKAKRKQDNLRREASSLENSWYKRNYFGDYLNSLASKAAIKRVENTLRRQNEQNRAYAAINGATPEYAVARNNQGLNMLENVVTSIASQAEAHKRNVDSTHLQNRQAIMNGQLQDISLDEKMAAQSASNGLNLFKDALMGRKWGNEDL